MTLNATCHMPHAIGAAGPCWSQVPGQAHATQLRSECHRLQPCMIIIITTTFLLCAPLLQDWIDLIEGRLKTTHKKFQQLIAQHDAVYNPSGVPFKGAKRVAEGSAETTEEAAAVSLDVVDTTKEQLQPTVTVRGGSASSRAKSQCFPRSGHRGWVHRSRSQVPGLGSPIPLWLGASQVGHGMLRTSSW